MRRLATRVASPHRGFVGRQALPALALKIKIGAPPETCTLAVSSRTATQPVLPVPPQVPELMWGMPGSMLACVAMDELTGEPRWRSIFEIQAERLLGDLMTSEDGAIWVQDLYGKRQNFSAPCMATRATRFRSCAGGSGCQTLNAILSPTLYHARSVPMRGAPKSALRGAARSATTNRPGFASIATALPVWSRRLPMRLSHPLSSTRCCAMQDNLPGRRGRSQRAPIYVMAPAATAMHSSSCFAEPATPSGLRAPVHSP